MGYVPRMQHNQVMRPSGRFNTAQKTFFGVLGLIGILPTVAVATALMPTGETCHSPAATSNDYPLPRNLLGGTVRAETTNGRHIPGHYLRFTETVVGADGEPLEPPVESRGLGAGSTILANLTMPTALPANATVRLTARFEAPAGSAACGTAPNTVFGDVQPVWTPPIVGTHVQWATLPGSLLR